MKFNLYPFLLITLTMNWSPLLASIRATPLFQPKAESQIAMDSYGNIIEVFTKRGNMIQAERYKHATNAWTRPIDLSAHESDAHSPQIAFNLKGDAIVIWKIREGVDEKLQTSLYSIATDQWTKAKNLSSFEKNIIVTHFAMDECGNAFVAYKCAGQEIAKMISFSPDSNQWSSLHHRLLPKEVPYNCKFFLNTLKNEILIKKSPEDK